MSELKAFESERIYCAVEQVEREAGDIDNLHLDDNLFYLKSEADKVIADLEESHEKEIGRLRAELEYSTFKPNFAKVIADKDAKILALDAEVFKQKRHAELFLGERNYAETQLRHQKYKRCLAMAKMCGIMSAFEDGEWYAKWINKWYKRWLELADKYKEEA